MLTRVYKISAFVPLRACVCLLVAEEHILSVFTTHPPAADRKQEGSWSFA